jgi:signal transduction histidine kinase
VTQRSFLSFDAKTSTDFRRYLAVSASYCVIYVLVDAAIRLLVNAPLTSVPWHPQPALAVTLIASGGIGYAPAVFVSGLLAEWIARAGEAAGFAYLIHWTGVAASYCAAGWAIDRWTHWPSLDVGLRDLTMFVVIAIATGLMVAFFAALTLLASGPAEAGRLSGPAVNVVIGEIVGLVVLAPTLMQLLAGAWKPWLATPAARRMALRDLSLFVLTMASVLTIVFGLKPFDEFRMFYLMFLPMIAVAMRYGLAGAALALPIVQVGLIVALAVFAARAATAFEFQLLMLALAVTSLYLGMTSTERERATARWAQGERELREQREALSEAQRTASTAELAAAVAHDLNQPLSAIGTFANACRLMVERGGADRAAILKVLDQLAAESARAGQYVRRMREFFRTGAARDERVDLRRLIETAHAHLRDRLQREGIAWDASIAPDLPPARGDVVQLAAVLDNLFANACDALHLAPGRRALVVTAARVPDAEHPMVRVCVEDSGPGVPPEVREQLFKPLATSKPHGMGLGLALSRSIAERLGGTLWFDSEAPRTTFCLDLPADG